MKLDFEVVAKFYLSVLMINLRFCEFKSKSIWYLALFENVLKMIYLKQLLYDKYCEDSLKIKKLAKFSLPSEFTLRIIGFDQIKDSSNALIFDSIYFFNQIKSSIQLSENEIAQDTILLETDHIPIVYNISERREDGRFVDKYGLVNINSFKAAVNQIIIESSADADHWKKDNFFNSSVESFADFTQDYRKIKEEWINNAEGNRRKVERKQNEIRETLRKRGFSDRQIEENPDYKSQTVLIHEFTEAIEVNYRDLSQFPSDFVGFKLTTEERRDINYYTSILQMVPKTDLMSLGFDPDSFVFKTYPNNTEDTFGAPTVSVSDISPGPTSHPGLFRMYNEFLQYELSIKKNIHYMPANLTNFFTNANEVNETQVEELLENTSELIDRLREIDEHPYSAMSIVALANDRGFEYGMERVSYPKNLVRIIFEKEKYDLLAQLMADHEHGMRSIFVLDQENIFRAAFKKRDGNFAITRLAELRFKFSEIQKKALFRRILFESKMEAPSYNLFVNLVYIYKVIDMFEYQKDRGITFFQEMIMQGSEGLKSTFLSFVEVTDPSQVVKFIPIVSAPTEADLNSFADEDVYWRPSFDNVPNKYNGVTIKKGWDNLTIAAATNSYNIFSWLLRYDVSKELLCRVAPFIKHKDQKLYTC